MTASREERHLARPSIEDRLAIEDLFTRYTTALDEGDVEGVVGCFTEDGRIDSPIVGRHEGRSQLRDFAEKTAEPIRLRDARFRHVVTNLRIEAADGRARARCYLLDFVTIDGETKLLSPGEYDCDLVKVGEEWLFTSRRVHMDRMFSIP
jgi:3-phenylpropionate/cinnamic acid dioxygenase small subunit